MNKQKIRFKRIYLEITNVCNLSCSFCPKTTRDSKFISESEFNHIIQETSKYTKHIYFHVMGEPLLHPKVNFFLDECKYFDIFVNLTTNGTLIKNHYDIIEKESLRMVNFSIHSFEKNSNTRNFDKYLDEILKFTELVRKNRPSIIISFRLWNEDVKKENNNNQYILDSIDKFFNLKGEIFQLEKIQRGQKIIDNVYLSQATKFNWPNLNNKNQKNEGFCLGLREQIAILSDGTVVPCCLDNEGTISLGNIFKSSLEEILENKRAKEFINNFSKRNAVEDLCQNCSYKNRFN